MKTRKRKLRLPKFQTGANPPPIEETDILPYDPRFEDMLDYSDPVDEPEHVIKINEKVLDNIVHYDLNSSSQYERPKIHPIVRAANKAISDSRPLVRRFYDQVFADKFKQKGTPVDSNKSIMKIFDSTPVQFRGRSNTTSGEFSPSDNNSIYMYDMGVGLSRGNTPDLGETGRTLTHEFRHAMDHVGRKYTDEEKNIIRDAYGTSAPIDEFLSTNTEAQFNIWRDNFENSKKLNSIIQNMPEDRYLDYLDVNNYVRPLVLELRKMPKSKERTNRINKLKKAAMTVAYNDTPADRDMLYAKYGKSPLLIPNLY